jgi:hypothetical protein
MPPEFPIHGETPFRDICNKTKALTTPQNLSFQHAIPPMSQEMLLWPEKAWQAAYRFGRHRLADLKLGKNRINLPPFTHPARAWEVVNRGKLDTFVRASSG